MSDLILTDFMQNFRFHNRNIYQVILITFIVLLSACAISPPVQEMSNARQSIRAATEVDAESYAPDLLSEAKQRLNSARSELDAGEYERAKLMALEAQQLALKARQLAISKRKNEH